MCKTTKQDYDFLDCCTLVDATEETALASAAKAGCPEAARRLTESVSRLVLKLAARVSGFYGVGVDDVFQEGQLAVAACLHGFDPERGRWTTYAGSSAWRRMKRFAFNEAKRRLPSADDVLYRVAALDRSDEDLTEELEAMRRHLPSLDKRDQDVLRMRFFYGMTFREVAAQLGVCNERVRQIQNRAVDRLGRLMKEEERCRSLSPAV